MLWKLTQPGLVFFWKSHFWWIGGLVGLGVGASRTAVKKHASSQKMFVHFTWSFVHILYWQYGISLDKKIDKCHFAILWWRHHESHVLTFSKILGIDVFLLVQWVCKIHWKEAAENGSKKAIIILQYKKIFQKAISAIASKYVYINFLVWQKLVLLKNGDASHSWLK